MATKLATKIGISFDYFYFLGYNEYRKRAVARNNYPMQNRLRRWHVFDYLKITVNQPKSDGYFFVDFTSSRTNSTRAITKLPATNMSVKTSKVDKSSSSFLLDFDELPMGTTYLSEIRATALTFLQKPLYHIHTKKPSDFEKIRRLFCVLCPKSR